MRRRLAGLALIIAIVALAIFFADRPGSLSITWLGWRIETGIGVAILGLLLAIFLVWGTLSLALRLIRTPRHLASRRRHARQLEAYRVLSSGLVAVAAGDARGALKLQKRADALFRKGRLESPPLSRLLAAQTALMQGRDDEAQGSFTAMLGDPETEFLGLRGLIVQALKSGDDATALRLTLRANQLKPSSPWVLQSQLALEARAHEWRQAADTLKQAVKCGAISAETGRRYQAALLVARSRQATEEDRDRDALAYASQAHGLDNGFTPAAAHYAQLLADADRAGKGLKILEEAWRRASHPAIAQAYARLMGPETPVERLRRFARLVDLRPADPESHLAAASVALEARLWGEARRHLERAGATGPGPWDARLCHRMVELERGERNDEQTARLWADRAREAAPLPRWVCGSCGGESAEWEPLCPACHGFATLSWRIPDAHTVRADGAAVTPQPLPHPLGGGIKAPVSNASGPPADELFDPGASDVLGSRIPAN